MLSSKSSLPIWSPHQISESSGVEAILLQLVAESNLSSQIVTDLQYALGVGASVWNSEFLHITRDSISKPAHPDGCLHYVLGWLATDPYLECLDYWNNSAPFFRDLFTLAQSIRKLDAFKHCRSGPIKMVSERLIDGNSYVRRGHLPFLELLFRTWKQSSPACVPQIALWAAYLNHQANHDSYGQSVFDEPVLELLSQVRNALAPERNGGVKWLSLKEALFNMPPQRRPQDIGIYLSSRNSNHECWKEVTRNINKLGVSSKAIVYMGSWNFRSTAERTELLRRFDFYENDPNEQLDVDEEIALNRPPPTKPSSRKNPQKSKGQNQPQDSKKAKKDSPTFEESYLAEIYGKIGSVFLEFAQRAYFTENPYLPADNSVDITRFIEEVDLAELLQTDDQQVQAGKYTREEVLNLEALIWTAIQIGGTLSAAASLVIHYIPQKGWGLMPELNGVWRTRAQQQRVTPDVDESLFLPVQKLEKRLFPDRIRESLRQSWTAKSTYLGTITSLSKVRIAEALRIVGTRLSMMRQDWTSNLLRVNLVKTLKNETHALLVQSNSETNFTSDAAYYSVISGSPDSPINIAGSPYAFRLEEFSKHLNRFLNQSYPDNPIEAWNLWVDKVLIILSCATGVRPVVDLFAEVDNFSADFTLLIVDDKEVVTRDPRRIVRLPKFASDLLKNTYLPSLQRLKGALAEGHPLRKTIGDLIERDVSSKIPFFFHLSEQGVQRIHFAEIARKIHPGLPPNFARHLISNHLKVHDRELVGIQLGHQIEGLYSFGPTSLRTLQNDLNILAVALGELLETLGIRTPISPILPMGELKIAASTPTTFGKKARSLAMLKQYRELYKRAYGLATAKIDDQKQMGQINNPRELLRSVVVELEASVWTTSERRVIPRICIRHFSRLLPDLAHLFVKPQKNRQENIVFNTALLHDLEARQSTHAALMKLLRNTKPQSKSDALVLVALSLAKNNGVTDPELFSRLKNERFEYFEHDGNLMLEIYPGKQQRENETCHRHQLTKNTAELLESLERFRFIKSKKKKGNLEDDLRCALSAILSNVPQSASVEEIIAAVQQYEYAYQRFTLPAALAEIARGHTPHRSADRESWMALKGLPSSADQTNRSAAPEIVDVARQSTPITKLIRHLIRSIDTQNAEVDELFKGVNKVPLANKALMTYTESLLKRRGQGRPTLANSTKRLYLGRLCEFFQRTDALTAIDGLDRDSLQETIDAYLDERSSSTDSVNDDARQIKDFCNALLKSGFPAPLNVPFLDSDFNPSTTLLSGTEINKIDEIIYDQASDQEISAYTLYRHYGFRRTEGLHQGIARIFEDGDELVMQIRGDATFRTKTPGSNRNARSMEALPRRALDAIKVCKNLGKNLDSPYLTAKKDHEAIVENIQIAMRKISPRAHIHVLRHNYADNLLRDLFDCSIWRVRRQSFEISKGLHLTTPQGIQRHTLQAAARLLGHSSPTMLLTTYSHCAFEVLDGFYRQSTSKNARANAQIEELREAEIEPDAARNTEPNLAVNPLPPAQSTPENYKNLTVQTPINLPAIRAIDQITRKLAMLENVIELNCKMPFLELSNFLRLLPPTHRPSLGDDTNIKYLKITKVFVQELAEHHVLQQPVSSVFSELTSYVTKVTSKFYQYEPKIIRTQRKRQIERFYVKTPVFQPIGNFNKDKLFAVREGHLDLDLALFFSIIKISQTKFSDYSFKTEAPLDHPVSQELANLGFGITKLDKNDHRKTLEFNLEHGKYWLFTVNTSRTAKIENQDISSKVSEKEQSEKQTKKPTKKPKVEIENSPHRPFDNSKMYLYALTLQLLILLNHEN